jgi:hypothetical protein
MSDGADDNHPGARREMTLNTGVDAVFACGAAAARVRPRIEESA